MKLNWQISQGKNAYLENKILIECAEKTSFMMKINHFENLAMPKAVKRGLFRLFLKIYMVAKYQKKLNE